VSTGSVLRLGALALIWGASFLFIKVGVQGMHPTLVALGRIAIGAAVVVVLLGVRRVSLPTGGREWLRLAFVGLGANTLAFTCIALGEQRISSALAAVLNATTPLFTALVAVYVFRTEVMTIRRAAGILLGFGGVAAIVAPGARGVGGSVAGSLLIVAASAAYGIAYSFQKRFVTSPPFRAAAGQLLCATGGAAVLAALTARGAPFVLTLPRALAVTTLGALGTGIATVIFLRLVADEGATTALFVTYLVPFVSVVLGRVVLDETLRWNAYAGGAVVIAGIAIAETKTART
jgi:drug/metabolite transporter (DMT)-like permease